ncbi:MAG: tRNA pseudouridine(38-40) synthase TruA [Lachnospiraceae bacterium]|nr:tRNA pseudouridine(38-40) synthase TruA [Lachnospiraceae bacterium]
MRRIMLRVAYDGTDYCGWQFQPGQDTIEGQLNTALSAMLKEDIAVTGASRTDAGVHSMGNVCVFDTSRDIPAPNVARAINGWLPDNIVVTESRQVPEGFHPRHCDCVKTYEYRIYNAKTDNPQLNRYSYHYDKPLDVGNMQQAADYMVGEHDFTSLCAVASDALTKVRTIYDINVTKTCNLVAIRVRGSGFLYNMVRIIAGTLIWAGTGRIEPEDVVQIIDGRDRALAGPTAPARGLTQIGIEYDEKLLTLKEECE